MGSRLDPVTGDFSYRPTAPHGALSVTVRAFDPRGAFVLRTFALSTQPDTTPPVVTVSITPRRVGIGQPVTIVISTIEPTADPTIQVTVTHNGVPTPLVPDQFGRIVYTPGALGQYVIEVVVTDGSGNVGRAIDAFSVPDPNDVTPPVVAIATPVEDEVVLMQTAITGTVSDDNLLSYTVYLKRNDDEQWFQIGSGTQNVFGGQIGIVDGTLLTNGLMTLRVVAKDINGQTSYDERPIGVDGGAKIGVVQLSFTDMTIPVAGVPLTITRTYDSRVKTKQDFGIGWSLGMSAIGKVFHNRKPGDGWSITKKIGFGNPLCSQVTELKSHITEVRLGERTFFRFKPVITETAGGLGFCEGRMEFVQTGGTRPGAKLEIIGKEPFVYQQNAATELRDWDDLTVSEVANVRLTTPDGNVIDMNTRRGVTRFADGNGNAVAVGPGGLISNTGLGLPFVRDSQGRIVQITDPMGFAVSYQYDENGDLILVRDRKDGSTEFRYSNQLPHLLEGIVDELGVKAMTNRFDSAGRLQATLDSMSLATSFEHDIANSTEVVTNRLGDSVFYVYDVRGNVTQFADALGAITQRVYDARDNLIRSQDTLGRTSTLTYDMAGNLTSIRDPEGGTRFFAHDVAGRILTESDDEGVLLTNTYDQRGNLQQVTDATGVSIDYRHDAYGNVTSILDGLGNEIQRLTYDLYGSLRETEDARGTRLTSTYDANGRLVDEERVVLRPDGSTATAHYGYAYDPQGNITHYVKPDGSTFELEYDAAGQRTRLRTRLGFTHEYEFDALGNEVREIFPDGSTELASFDAEGRLVSLTSRDGVQTRFEFDKVGREVVARFADGRRRERSFDAIGRVVLEKDEGGRVTTYGYLGRTVVSQDAMGHRSERQYDQSGLLTRTVDATGRTYDILYDRAGRPTLYRGTAGFERRTSYDELGRREIVIDELGRPTNFRYDAGGRLSAVTSPAGHTTTYRYAGDSVAEVSDAKGRITRTSYDYSTRVFSRTLPLGQVESFHYDAQGGLSEHRTFAGNVISVERNVDRSVLRRCAQGSCNSFDYGQNGLRSRADGEAFTYDVRGRVLSDTKPNGDRIEYEYWEGGELKEIRGPQGTIRYDYDSVGRLFSVRDQGGATTSYEYDPAGRPIAASYPNGVVLSAEYDLSGLLSRATWRKSDTILAEYEYSRDPRGRVTSVSEALTGRTVAYAYDLDSNLISEDLFDPLTGSRLTAYSYDEVGNRVSKVVSETGLTEYSYDENNQLIGQSGSEGSSVYTYDPDGNLRGTGDWNYQYDALGRMVQADSVESSIAIAYDSDGLRTTVRRAGHGSRQFLVDKNRPISQVLVERNEQGAITASYVFGRDLIAVTSPSGEVARVHADGLGSVRFLTDSEGSVTQTFSSDAFGVRSIDSSAELTQPYGFQGQEFDSDLGLYYLRARYLDPATGRFLSRDPLRASPNAYAYSSDPINFSDLTGLESTLTGIQVSISILVQAEIRLKSERKSESSQLAELATLHKQNLLPFVDEMKTSGYDTNADWWFPGVNASSTGPLHQNWASVASNARKVSLVTNTTATNLHLYVRGVCSADFVAAIAGANQLYFHPTHPDINSDSQVLLCPGFLSWPTNTEFQGRVHPLDRVGLVIHELTHFSNVGASHGHNSLNNEFGTPYQSTETALRIQKVSANIAYVRRQIQRAGQQGGMDTTAPLAALKEIEDGNAVYLPLSNAFAYQYQARDYLFGEYSEDWQYPAPPAF